MMGLGSLVQTLSYLSGYRKGVLWFGRALLRSNTGMRTCIHGVSVSCSIYAVSLLVRSV